MCAVKSDKRKAHKIMLQAGDVAPDFELPSEGEKPIRLSRFRGRQVVLYFYPKDDTPGCTIEAQEFSAAAKSFERQGAVVIGVSPDTPACHARFKAKHGLAIHLASDDKAAVASMYGVWVEKQMFGRKYMGVARTTFLISPEGRIERVWRRVKPKGHAAEILAAITCG